MLIVTVPGGYMELWLPFEHFLQNLVLKNDLAMTTVQSHISTLDQYVTYCTAGESRQDKRELAS